MWPANGLPHAPASIKSFKRPYTEVSRLGPCPRPAKLPYCRQPGRFAARDRGNAGPLVRSMRTSVQPSAFPEANRPLNRHRVSAQPRFHGGCSGRSAGGRRRDGNHGVGGEAAAGCTRSSEIGFGAWARLFPAQCLHGVDLGGAERRGQHRGNRNGQQDHGGDAVDGRVEGAACPFGEQIPERKPFRFRHTAG